MPTISSLHGGIAENNVYMGENQCAYAENLYIRDPEGVTLAQKPENMFLTGQNLILGYDRGIFVGENGAVLDEEGNETLLSDDTSKTDILGDADLYDIDNRGWMSICLGQDNQIYIWNNTNSGGSRWQDRGFLGPHNCILNDGNYMLIGAYGSIAKIYENDIDFTNGNLPSPFGVKVRGGGTVPLLIKFTGQSIVSVSANGTVSRRDGYSPLMNTKYFNELEFWQSFYSNGTTFVIPGDDISNTGLGYLQGDIFQQIAHQGETDGYKKYNVGRKYRFGKDIKASIADKVYLANNDKLASYGKDYSIFKDAYNIDLTHASNGKMIQEIGLVSTTSDPGYIQFGWRDEDGNCGVDKLAVAKPTKYVSDGMFYSRKYQLGAEKLKTVRGFKMRADAMNGTAIDVYVSIDGGDFTHVCTHSYVGQEILKPYSHNFLAREIQWKFVFSSPSETITPTFKAFTFDLE